MTQGETEATRRLGNLRVLFAPAARDAASIVDDPNAYAVAQAIIDAMAIQDATQMRRSDILAAAGLNPDDALVRSRFDLFVRLGMLRAVRGDKPHQQRYYLHPFALIGGELLARLAEQGAAVELHALLTAAADRVTAEDATVEDAAAAITRVTGALSSFAQMLEDVVAHGTIAEMLAARNGHHANRYFETVQQVARVVRQRFADLLHPAMQLVAVGQRYVDAVTGLIARVRQEVAARPGQSLFALVDPDRYLNAAITEPARHLAGVWDTAVLDRARPVVDLKALARVVDDVAAVPPPRRVAEPAATTTDAVEVLTDHLARQAADQDRRARRLDRHLGALPEGDLSDQFDTWPAAAIWLADLLALGRDPARPYAVDLSDVQVVDPEADVAVRLWVRARRLAGITTQAPEHAAVREHADG